METIKEAAGKCGGCRLSCLTECETFETNDEKTACCNRLERRGFVQGVAWAERWIPVEEELPPIGKNVTILLKGEDENGKETFNVHTFDKITNHKRLKGWFDFYDFTHWRPINHE